MFTMCNNRTLWLNLRTELNRKRNISSLLPLRMQGHRFRCWAAASIQLPTFAGPAIRSRPCTGRTMLKKKNNTSRPQRCADTTHYKKKATCTNFSRELILSKPRYLLLYIIIIYEYINKKKSAICTRNLNYL